jgi:uncharacterized membrane protein
MSHPSRTPALIIGALAALVAVRSSAQMHPEKPTWDYEKCYGVARAGQNDCFTVRNSCAGTTSEDAEPQAWVYVPRGTCERISGGRLDQTKG